MPKTKKPEKTRVCFKLVDDSELKEILDRNKNLFMVKDACISPLPIIGIVNCYM